MSLEKITFGKYKDWTYVDILAKDRSYAKWLVSKSMMISPNAREFLTNSLASDETNEEYRLSFGKHKSKTLAWVYENDRGYFHWLKMSQYVNDNMNELKEAISKLDEDSSLTIHTDGS
jgi:hypothetical protein